MASEWALMRALAAVDVLGPKPGGSWSKTVEKIAAALDAARREGEQKSIAITHDLLSEAEQRGAERERWECHRLARACERERLSQMRTMDDFGRRDCVEAKATEATRIADAISARGPMRWREEGEE